VIFLQKYVIPKGWNYDKKSQSQISKPHRGDIKFIRLEITKAIALKELK